MKREGERVYVAANCIMEYMARLVQLRADGLFSSPEAFFHTLRDPRKIDYHLPFVLLVQEGILENPLGWPLLFPMLMTLMQTALLVDPLTITKEVASKYALKKDFLPQTIFLRALYDSAMLDAGLFGLLVGASKLADDSDMNTHTPHRDYANFLLQAVQWPSVEDLLECFRKDIDDNIDLVSNRSRARMTIEDSRERGIRFPSLLVQSHEAGKHLPVGERRRQQLENFRELCNQVWSDDKIIVDPAHLQEQAPKPIMAEIREGGLATWCQDEAQTFWDVHFEMTSSLMFHICQKIFFAKDLACYSDPFGETSKFDCPFMAKCVAVPRKVGLSFCFRDEWKGLVENVLRSYEVEVVP